MLTVSLLEIPFRLAMGVMAIGAGHFAFSDRVMRWQHRAAPDLRMALVARLRFVDRHWQPLGPLHRCVADIGHLRHIAVRMRVVAVGTRHTGQVVRRGMPCLER